MSAGPRTKRPFAGAASDPAQRQITAFFNKTSSTGSSDAHSDNPATTPTPTPLNGPTLPAQVQSNLLSVGMRIRKAIPEGHKTGSPYSAFSLWSEMESKPGNSSSDLRPVPAMPGGGVSRELTPFCGIHKVGGLAVQPTADPFNYTPHHVGTNSVTSSQESITSTTSTTSAMAMQATSSATINRKRFYVTEEEEEQQQQQGGRALNSSTSSIAWRNRADWLDGEISPRSLAPAEWSENSRIMAVPRRRIAGNGKSGGGDNDRLLPPGAPTPADGDNQENMAVDDFDEAPFLDYRIAGSGGDMDLE